MLRIVTLTLIAGVFLTLVCNATEANKERKVRYKYLTFVPDNYDQSKKDLYPVIFYLHGRSVSGTDLNRIKRYGLPFFLERGKKINYIVIAPQCPWGKNWASENWFDTIYAEVSAKYRIDSSRIYLTGMSLGGFGTWELANKYPDRFAAIAPLCGGGKTEWVDNLSHIPTWVFHGTADRQVPVSRSDKMVEALKQHQSVVEYSRMPGKGHDIHKVYDDDRLYEWFSHFSRRPSPDELPKPIPMIRLAEFSCPKLIENFSEKRELMSPVYF